MVDFLTAVLNHAFIDAAIRSKSAVLVSHLRSLGGSDESGTPSDLLDREYDRIVEVCCMCTPEIALARFLSRTRHPGHLDSQNDANELAQRMAAWAGRFPPGIGTLVKIRTERTFDINALIKDAQVAF
ncbi:MAG: hypothetical protein AAGJ28_21440, partial [Pseudomonadota bacterium]